MNSNSETARKPATKITEGLVEAIRAKILINAVYAVDGFELTEGEAIDVLAKIDAVDPLRPECHQ